MDEGALIEHIDALRRASVRPVVVGISGYCGSGKSTLARSVVAALPGAVRMRGDDFLDPVRSHRRSTDWDGVERTRLVDEVLAPLRTGIQSTFRRFDWARGELSAPEPVPATDLLVVDLIGLFHPESLPALDLTVWCDVDLETAAERGMARDRRLVRSHDEPWRQVWVPNERDFEHAYAPKEHSAVMYSTR
ncbi:AAA family ATPase [Planctomonas sp. JC2975]|uniref:uridine kinase family protein n=1 Tax=Planctomonas sp. JC2975 TaxID=2729626 RepID=UPI0014759975|nr:AAA family ATPase [Planctomonas sp. JC2975]NNC13604.1 AAA family ATPase [Planctomonas sp. JC2975]